MRKSKNKIYEDELYKLKPIITIEKINFNGKEIDIPFIEPFVIPANRNATLKINKEALNEQETKSL